MAGEAAEQATRSGSQANLVGARGDGHEGAVEIEEQGDAGAVAKARGHRIPVSEQIRKGARRTRSWRRRRLDPIGSVDANLGEIGKKIGRPAIDVVFPDVVPHAPHALGLFLLGHLEGAMDGLGNLLHVVGIDQQGVGKLVGSAGESAEDQDALFVVAGGDKFLGDQIHSVVQRGDHAHGGGAVVASDLLVRVMPFRARRSASSGRPGIAD